MPKTKRKGSKKKTTTRRKVGAAALNLKNPMVAILPVAGGFFLGDMINDKIDTLLPDDKLSQKAKGMVEGGLGAALILMKIGKKKTAVEVVAGGVLAGAGLRRLLKEFGVLNGIGGYQSVPAIANRERRRLNGYGAVPVVGNGGYKTSQYQLNGSLNGVGGYNVPPVPAGVGVMGSTGSGLNSGSDYMQ